MRAFFSSSSTTLPTPRSSNRSKRRRRTFSDDRSCFLNRHEIIDVVVGLQDDIATLAAVAAARPTLGLERFMRKREATVAALAGPDLNLD